MSIALVIHGGAGVIPRDRLSAEGEARRRAVLRDALAAGEALLEGGAPALDAVVAAVRVLEEAPEFNAGRGGVLNTEGTVQHDASIMCGATRQAGGVAGVTGVRSPILAARAVMERSAHVLLVGQGALSFARDQGLELMDPAWFVTPGRARQLERALERRKVVRDHDLFEEEDDRADAARGLQSDPSASLGDDGSQGTVGAVALDLQGHLAAATSTGGMTGKLPGRVGDSALIGAGTWAADATCAVSATGHGEAFIRHHVASRVADLMELAGLDLEQATQRVIRELPHESGGLIAVDRSGAIAMPMNCGGMYRAWRTRDGDRGTAIW